MFCGLFKGINVVQKKVTLYGVWQVDDVSIQVGSFNRSRFYILQARGSRALVLTEAVGACIRSFTVSARSA